MPCLFKCLSCTVLIGLFVYDHQAEFVPQPDPSLTEQYEYASEHDIRCLVIITDAGVSRTDVVKVIMIKTCSELCCILYGGML